MFKLRGKSSFDVSGDNRRTANRMNIRRYLYVRYPSKNTGKYIALQSVKLIFRTTLQGLNTADWLPTV